MNKKMVIGFISAVLILMTGCTNLGGTSSSKSPMSQEKIAASVDINEEVYGIGSALIEESGNGVAKMRASKEAREDIKVKLLKETKDVLTAYLIEIDFYSKKISENVINDLSEYITNSMLNDVEEKDSWIENEKVYTVITLDRNEIPLHSRDTFITHIDSIIEKLTSLRAEVMSIPLENVGSKETAPETAPVKQSTTSGTEEAIAPETVLVEEGTPVEVEAVEAPEEDIIDVQL